MIFETWLRKQKKRDDRTGDLARDFINTGVDTIKASFNRHSLCEDAIESFVAAVEEWKKYACPLLITDTEEEDF